MASTQPLLASRASSDHSEDARAEAEDAALHGGQIQQSGRQGSFWRQLALFLWALIATAAVIILAVLYQHHTQSDGKSNRKGLKPELRDSYKIPKGKRNMIFMVSDGMGPTSLSMTRSFRQETAGLKMDDVLVLDHHLIGSSRTRSSSSLITDSAAGATAFSCGFKSYNGAISVLPGGDPCGTVLEAAKLAGYMTGLVVTTRITDATPACFAAHVTSRDQEDLIAQQMIGQGPLNRTLDLMIGGGRCHFLPQGMEGSCRGDTRNVVEEAVANGWNYFSTRKEFDALNTDEPIGLPLMGLLADHDIPYEVDRRTQSKVYPSLEETAETAIKILTKATEDSDQGFFLMIEGSRIDHAGHGNDPVAQVHEVLAYDKAFQMVLRYIEDEKDSDVSNVVISTSDHETGGLAAARQLHSGYPDYLWYPRVLGNATHSGEYLASRLFQYDGPSDTLPRYVQEELLGKGMGIYDPSSMELNTLLYHPELAAYTFADMVSRRAQIGWSTHGHSAVDVNIYGAGKGFRKLAGNHENTEIGEFMEEYMGVDVQAVTQRLLKYGKQQGTEWMGRPVPEGWIHQFDHYAHDH